MLVLKNMTVREQVLGAVEGIVSIGRRGQKWQFHSWIWAPESAAARVISSRFTTAGISASRPVGSLCEDGDGGDGWGDSRTWVIHVLKIHSETSHSSLQEQQNHVKSAGCLWPFLWGAALLLGVGPPPPQCLLTEATTSLSHNHNPAWLHRNFNLRPWDDRVCSVPWEQLSVLSQVHWASLTLQIYDWGHSALPEAPLVLCVLSTGPGRAHNQRQTGLKMCVVTQNPKHTKYMKYVGIPPPLQKKGELASNLKWVHGTRLGKHN